MFDARLLRVHMLMMLNLFYARIISYLKIFDTGKFD